MLSFQFVKLPLQLLLHYLWVGLPASQAGDLPEQPADQAGFAAQVGGYLLGILSQHTLHQPGNGAEVGNLAQTALCDASLR